MRSCASSSRSPAGRWRAHGLRARIGGCSCSSHVSPRPGEVPRSSSSQRPSCAGTDKPSSASGVGSPSARERRLGSAPIRSPSSRPWLRTTGSGAPSGSGGTAQAQPSRGQAHDPAVHAPGPAFTTAWPALGDVFAQSCSRHLGVRFRPDLRPALPTDLRVLPGRTRVAAGRARRSNALTFEHLGDLATPRSDDLG